MSAWTISSTAAISSIQTPRKFAGSIPQVFLRNRQNIFKVSTSSLSFPCQYNAWIIKGHKLSMFDFRIISSNVEQSRERFFNSGSLQPIGTSLGNSAKMVTFVSLWSLIFVLARSIVRDSMASKLLSSFLIFVKFSLLATSLDLSNLKLFRWLNFTYNSRLLRFWAKGRMLRST